MMVPGECTVVHTERKKTGWRKFRESGHTQAEIVFSDELKNQVIALKGDFQLCDCYCHR